MSPPRMRPRFETDLPAQAETWLGRLEKRLRDNDGPCRGRVFRRHAMLWIRDEERRFWSPFLNLEIDEEDNPKPRLRGRFSPDPHVWTLFMAIYILLSLVGVAGLVYGFVQFSLGQTPWSLLIAPAAAAAFAFVYGATLIGQGMSAQQMYALRRVVDDVTEEVLETSLDP